MNWHHPQKPQPDIHLQAAGDNCGDNNDHDDYGGSGGEGAAARDDQGQGEASKPWQFPFVRQKGRKLLPEGLWFMVAKRVKATDPRAFRNIEC